MQLRNRLLTFSLHPLTLIIGAWLAAVLSRITKNGEIYGLNYYLLQPDGALYHALTLRFLGSSWEQSIYAVNEFFLQHAGYQYFSETISNDVIRVLQTRPLLSILSIPFVALIGQWGMIIVPSLSLLLIGITFWKVGKLLKAEFLAVALFTILTLSLTVSRWMISDLTDPISVAMFAILCLGMLLGLSTGKLILITFLALVTRPIGPIIIVALIPFLHDTSRRKVLTVTSFAALGTIALSLYSPHSAGTATSGDYTLKNRIMDFPEHLVKVVFVEFGQLFVMDRLLFLFLVFSVVIALATFTNTWSKSFLAVLIVTFLMGAWNGALGVNYRYQLTSLISASFMILVNANKFSTLKDKLTRSLNQKPKS
jgi:hypothetical protein